MIYHIDNYENISFQFASKILFLTDCSNSASFVRAESLGFDPISTTKLKETLLAVPITDISDNAIAFIPPNRQNAINRFSSLLN
jgi:hypothetical protein